MGCQGRNTPGRFLCMLLSAWLVGVGIECAEQKVHATIFATSNDQTSIIVFATDDMTFAVYNDTFPKFKFLIKELDAFHTESNALIQKYRNDLRALNTDVLNEMADRIPKDQIDIPTVYLYLDKPITLHERNVLNCFVYELFPPAVHVSFLKNGQPLSGQVNSSEFTFDDTWKFRILKYVEIEPAAGDKYSCVVDTGANEPIIAAWEPEEAYKPYQSVQTAICAVGIVIGVLGLTTGLLLLFYKRGNEVGSESQRI
ncbi:RLA class II histocompatibility antigen, DP alpha-1 chain-like [Heptranchias perlo]|uniref:RLA class II histocompatibility antigen, DP alpha-1 chain-like n=1 Tax=Heptranchias perlo TaxID=212740 RepID=UPI00355AA689